MHDFSKLKMRLAAIEKRRLRIVEERDDKLDRLKYKRKKKKKKMNAAPSLPRGNVKRLNRQGGVCKQMMQSIYIETNIFKPLGGRRKGPCTY